MKAQEIQSKRKSGGFHRNSIFQSSSFDSGAGDCHQDGSSSIMNKKKSKQTSIFQDQGLSRSAIFKKKLEETNKESKNRVFRDNKLVSNSKQSPKKTLNIRKLVKAKIDGGIMSRFKSSNEFNDDLDTLCQDSKLVFTVNRRFPAKWKFMPLPQMKQDEEIPLHPLVKKSDEPIMPKNEEIQTIDLELQGDLIHRCFSYKPWRVHESGTRTLVFKNTLPEAQSLNEQRQIKQELDCIKMEAYKNEDPDCFQSDDDDGGMLNFLTVGDTNYQITPKKLTYMEPYVPYLDLAKKEEAKVAKEEAPKMSEIKSEITKNSKKLKNRKLRFNFR